MNMIYVLSFSSMSSHFLKLRITVLIALLSCFVSVAAIISFDICVLELAMICFYCVWISYHEATGFPNPLARAAVYFLLIALHLLCFSITAAIPLSLQFPLSLSLRVCSDTELNVL